MQSDDDQIRELVRTWMAATRAGDVPRVLSLMTEDAVFLVAGREPMRKPEFAALAEAQANASESAPVVDGSSEIQEIRVIGDWAFMWTKLAVTMTPRDGGTPQHRAGHTLTILKKESGRWLLARDANLLVPVMVPPDR